jgi:N utilization substance protein B
MDCLIISIAIAELTYFESIPVKVTLDEWIDIAKYYSSPTSSTFVNGVLDKIVAEFKESGRINKSGRGLL